MTQVVLNIEDGFKERFFSILELMKDKVKIEKQQNVKEEREDDIFDLVGKVQWDGDIDSQRMQRMQDVSY